MEINPELLDKICKNMIETILLCLPHATKGTIYRIGPPPELRAVRIASGKRVTSNSHLEWGLPEKSDYNYPGKSWEQYCDKPGGILEAMGWCVERQKSWTSDNPDENIRSVRKQLSGEREDFHHMEPVLIPKAHLYSPHLPKPKYPKNFHGQEIWQDSNYEVGAVIKIHFLDYTIKRGDRSTKIIKKLSRSLGTELFSLYLREAALKAQKDLEEERYRMCNELAHELRNTLTKWSFVYSAINHEISFLREQWESLLAENYPDTMFKKDIIDQLNKELEDIACRLDSEDRQICIELLKKQREFSTLALLPQQGKMWIRNKLRPKWFEIFSSASLSADRQTRILALLKELENSLFLGQDPKLIRDLKTIPEDLKNMWVKIAYSSFPSSGDHFLDKIEEFLDHPFLNIPHKRQSRKIMGALKTLVRIIPEVEYKANKALRDISKGANGSSIIFPGTHP